MRIQHNIAAINSHRQLGMNNSAVGKNLEKLSSGYKINRAGDDAAGLAISEKMRAQITSLDTASKNAQDGISLVQTAEGALTEVHSMLNRMTELAGQAANGTYQNEVDRENAMKELDSLRTEIDRISQSTNYNGITLLDGTIGGGGTGANGVLGGVDLSFRAPEGMTLEFADGSGQAVGTNTASISGKTIKVTLGTQGGASKITEADINKALKDAGIDASVSLEKNITAGSGASLTMGAITSAASKNASVTVSGVKFESMTGGTDTRNIKINSSASGAAGVAVASNGNIEITLASGVSYSAEDINKLLKDGGVTDVKAIVNGNHTTGSSTIGAGNANLANGTGVSGAGLSLQIGESSDSFNQLSVRVKSMSAISLDLDKIDIGTQQGAKDAVAVIKDAINTVSSTRGDLGAIQNRLEHTINNLGVTSENMTAAESRIRDVDMAKEMMEFTKNNILTQASQSMLAQANQLPQGVLQLLQ